MTLSEKLTKMEACQEAIEWVGDKTLDEAWAQCERGDWMLWLAQESGVDKRTLTLAKARCAKLVVHLMKDERSVKAVEVAERYGLGEATDKELGQARRAAVAAAAADANAATYAGAGAGADANAATYAGAVADAAAYAAADDAYDAHAAVAYVAYAAAEREKVLSQCADICRQVIDIKLL
jgi:hypothetical protein